ncbi:MAG: rod shape-determining protein MreC [Anaerovorax sp.]
MKWLREYKKATIIACIIIALLTVMAVSYGNSGSSSPLGIGINNVLVKIQEPFYKAGVGLKNATRGIFHFKEVLQENEKLKAEISKLNNEVIELKLTENELKILGELSQSLNYENIRNNYEYVTGDVIAMDGSDWFNIFTVNVGTDRNIYKDAVVINGKGLVGRVMDVGPNWAKVMSIVDENNSVSFKSVRDMNLVGILSGNGKGGISGFMLDPEATILKGDLLITTGMGMYPEGIPIGKVVKVKKNSDTLLKTVEIEPAAYLKTQQKVIIIIPKA